jgi:hypothetical protein
MVRNADKVIYFEKGHVVAIVTFEEVKGLVPDFDSDA